MSWVKVYDATMPTEAVKVCKRCKINATMRYVETIQNTENPQEKIDRYTYLERCDTRRHALRHGEAWTSPTFHYMRDKL